MTNPPIHRTWSDTLAWCVSNTPMHRPVVASANTEYSLNSSGKVRVRTPALSKANPAIRNGMGASTNGISLVHGTPRTTRYEDVNANVKSINCARAYPVSVRCAAMVISAPTIPRETDTAHKPGLPRPTA